MAKPQTRRQPVDLARCGKRQPRETQHQPLVKRSGRPLTHGDGHSNDCLRHRPPSIPVDEWVAFGADQMRAPLLVGADTGMRPGELFALEWADIDLASHRIHVRRRLYRGELDLPKSNRTRTIALPPPARDVLLPQPTRHLDIVSASKTGRRLSQPAPAGYRAG